MKKIIIKDLFPHDWVTREAGEKLRLMIINALVEKKKLEVDFSGMRIASVSFFDEGLAKLKLEKLPLGWQEYLTVCNLNEWDKEVLQIVSKQRGIEIPLEKGAIKSHPWRLCPAGQHYVQGHDKKTKKGKIGHWKSFCRDNPSGKEVYTTDEIHEMASKFMGRELIYPQLSQNKEWNIYDILLAGWTQFWNETFTPSEKLSPNYIKALIISETRFKINASTENKKKKTGNAQGLVQLTEETVGLLDPTNKELSDHHFSISQKDIFDPNINICVAIRWLFRKREIAQSRLRRIPTWYEVLLEYKGILKDDSPKAIRIKTDLIQFLEDQGEKI